MDNAMVYLLLVQVVAGDLVPAGETLWSQLPTIEILCPGNNICPEARPQNLSDPDPISDFDVCCADCSCDPSCTDHGNCCFQKMDTMRESSDQECLYETLFPPTSFDRSVKSYYMVAKEPKSGCVAKFQEKSDSCCEADLAPWGSFLPVWSPSKGRIYKNRLYAECHGAIDYILWDVSQICKDVRELDSDLASCNIHFKFPGENEKIQTEQCFTDLFSTCPDEFIILPGIQNLTQQDIIEGCHSDFRSAYGGYPQLKNVYCYICMYNPYTMPIKQCSSPGGGRSPYGPKTFTSLLSKAFLTEYRPDQNRVPDKACEMAVDKVLAERCRPVYCPTGRTLSAVDGRCTFASQSWNIGDLQILLLLTFDNPNETLTYGAVRDLVNAGFTVNVPKKWAIGNAYIPIFGSVPLTADWKDDFLKSIHKNTLQRPANELLLSVYPKEKTGDPSKLMEIIQSRLSGQWTVRFGGIRLEASARLSDPKLDVLGHVNGIGWVLVPSFMKAKDNNGSRIFNESNAFLEVVRHVEMKTYVDVINKLYFCPQIELESHEFVLYSETQPLALLLVKGNKYFGNSEFKLRTTAGKPTARICLKDAGYHLFPQAASANQLCACVYVLTFLVYFYLRWCSII